MVKSKQIKIILGERAITDNFNEQNDHIKYELKTDYRPWGHYTVIAEAVGYLVKIIVVNSGQKLSVQSHNHRNEHWVVLEGTAKALLNGQEYVLKTGDCLDIKVKEIHSLQNPYEETLKLLEVQSGDLLSEEDIIRYEDIYGRA